MAVRKIQSYNWKRRIICVEKMETAEPSTVEPVENVTPAPKPEPAKTKTKAPKAPKQKAPARKRIALCHSCSNEWVASNGNEKKPSRCPVCFSRQVVWRDEDVKELEDQETEPVEKTETKVENTMAKGKSKKETEEEEDYDDFFFDDEMYGNDDDDFTYEDAKAAVPKIPMQAIVFIVGGIALFAGIMFLVGKGKKRIPAPAKSSQPKAEEEQNPAVYLPSVGNIGGGLF